MSAVGFTTGLVITESTWLANTASHCDTEQSATRSALEKSPLACSVKLDWASPLLSVYACSIVLLNTDL